MVNVHDKAHELARALKESEQYKQYAAMKAQVDQNAELSAMINDFQEKNMAVQMQQMTTGQMDPAAMEQVKELYHILAANPVASHYLQTELMYTQLVTDVYGILGEVISFGRK